MVEDKASVGAAFPISVAGMKGGIIDTHVGITASDVSNILMSRDRKWMIVNVSRSMH